MNRTRSPLAKKYGQTAVVKARNAVAKEKGFKTVTEANSSQLPWGIIGLVAKREKAKMERKREEKKEYPKKDMTKEMTKLRKKK